MFSFMVFLSTLAMYLAVVGLVIAVLVGIAVVTTKPAVTYRSVDDADFPSPTIHKGQWVEQKGIAI